MNTPPPSSLSSIQQQALDWQTRLNSGDCSVAERGQFAAWLAENPAHLAAYREVERFWGQLAGLGNIAENHLVAARRYAAGRRLSQHRRRFWPALAMAAGLAGLLILNSPIGWWLRADYYQTAKGERKTVLLSDGSQIELNTDTELRVAYRDGERTVWLARGEAWFSVVHNASRPFEVVAGAGRVCDIGTQFNVYRQDDKVTVAVQEGEVGLRAGAMPSLNLSAGQQAGYDNAGRLDALVNGDLNAIAAWRSGVLVFKKQSLPEVLKQLGRYHRVRFELADADLQTLTVSGRFPANDLEQTLDTMASALSVKIIRGGDERITIRRAN
ncbi:FecR family protein [Methylomonas montana]|uniref:FecR family protein n=1 Tax=Methylomonas montana TaxID=3058963 RepID=UPI0026595C21|nr:FecR family protein [Methylomonas montana]WKJ90522.1 FecR family protein [Methylomonas montana]